MVGYDPDKDYLFDPQQRPDNRLRCGCCRRQIFFAEVYYTMFTGRQEMNICSGCFSEVEQSAQLMED